MLLAYLRSRAAGPRRELADIKPSASRRAKPARVVELAIIGGVLLSGVAGRSIRVRGETMGRRP